MQQLFIGLDVHKKTWAVTIQEERLVVKRFTIEADANRLITYIDNHFPATRWLVVMRVAAVATTFTTP